MISPFSSAFQQISSSTMGSGSVSRALLLSVCLLLPYRGCEGARILCVSHQFGSHMLMVHSVAEGLIERGHEVYTVYSDRMPVPKGLQEKGFKIVKYHTPEGGNVVASDDNAKHVLEDLLTGKPQDMDRSSAMSRKECIDMDNDADLNNQIKQLNIDLFIFDVFPLSSCLQFMALKYDLPFVIVPPVLELEIMRTPVLPSFMPLVLFEASDNMSFMERMKNSMMTLVISVPALSPFSAMKDTSLIQKYSKDPNVNTWKDVSRKAELFFVTRGAMLEYPYPLLPNVINVECITCKPAKALEPSIEAMIAAAKGVIVVSFGSLIAEFPDNVAEKFLKAFAERDEIIFWRYNANLPGNVPTNVKIMTWLPQNDLLAHPKTKLFITHSGNNGQYESLYHGVPMLAFPIFAEQPHNAHRIVDHGFGLRVDIRTFTTEDLADKMAEIIENPSYGMKTQKAARIIKSSHMDAGQTATHWIEHILEFGGEHLRSHALKMPWYSYYMIDILLLVEIVIVVIFCALIKLCCCVMRLKKRATAPKSKQKRQ